MLTSSNEHAYFRGRTRTRKADGLVFYITIYEPIYSSIFKHGIRFSDVFALSLLIRLARAKSHDEPFTFAWNSRRATTAAALNQKQNFCRGSARLREQSTGCGASPSPVVITMKKEEVHVAEEEGRVSLTAAARKVSAHTTLAPEGGGYYVTINFNWICGSRAAVPPRWSSSGNKRNARRIYPRARKARGGREGRGINN